MISRRIPASLEPNAWARRLAARRAEGRPVADLSGSNPTRLGLSPLAEAAAALSAVGPLAYAPEPRGEEGARRAVAGALAGRGLRADAEDILLTSSTSEGYAHLFRLLADPGDAVLFPSPSYPLFEPLALAEGIEARTYRLAFDGQWHLDRATLDAGRGARAIVVVEPNHPTGTCLDPQDRAFLEEFAEREGMAIVSDEVFGDHPWPDRTGRLPSWLDGSRGVPTFVLGGLSKLCGLPHLKLGWIVAAGPERERREALAGLEWIADLFLSVGAPVQAALPPLLELRHAFARRVRSRLGENLATLRGFVREVPEAALLPAEGGWSAVLRLPASRTSEQWALELIDRGFAAHPGEFYGLEPGEHLVVSLIVEPATLRAGCDALRILLRGA